MKNNKITIGKMLLIEIAVIIVILFTLMKTRFLTLSHLIDIPCFMGIILLTVPLLLASGMHKDFVRAFSIGKKEYSLLQMKKSLEAVNMVKNLVLCSIGFNVIIDFIVLLHRMTDVGQLGPSVAIMALSILYGIIFEFLLVPLSTYVQSHILEAMNIDDDEIDLPTDAENDIQEEDAQ